MTVNTPPVARKNPIERTHHGDTVIDDYEWLREKTNPEVIAHLTAENEWTSAKTAHHSDLRRTIYNEIKDRTLETDLSVPVREGDWWYYSWSIEGQQYAVHCRVPVTSEDDWEPPVWATPDAALPGEQVLLDGNAEARGHEFFSLGSFDVTGDGRLMVYGVDTLGDERFTLRLRRLPSVGPIDQDAQTDDDDADAIDVIPGTFHGAIFSPDGDYLYYTTVDDSWRPDTLWRHRVGTHRRDDVVVFHEPDDRYWLDISLSRSRQYLMIDVGSKITSEVHVLNAADPTGEFRVVWPRHEGVEYSVDHAVIDGSDRLLILHNHEAENFTLVDVPADDPTSSTDRVTLIPAGDSLRIESVEAFRSFLIVEYRRDGLTRLAVVPIPAQPSAVWTDPANGAGIGLEDFEVAFDQPLFTVGTGGNPEWQQPTVRFGYTSLVDPQTVYDLVVATGERRLLKQQPVLGDYNPEDYEQRREWAIAEDGTRVPISLVSRRLPAGADRESGRPLVLYGYGSYEVSMDPSFSIPRLSLLDRGVVFAIAHVRGGGELGRAWYEMGKTLTKRNTFTDFIAVAERLIAAGHTTPQQLIAQGGSAGGLLMGAVANLAPHLFAGIVAQVPFVDALTSILDPSLPLTVIEWDEWGDPLHDAEVYRYMKSYSPYENVRSDVEYPPILAVTSLNDTRVLYVEPAKWVARLREVGAPALLKTEMSAGHGGVSGRYERWKEIAFEYAWLLETAGVTD
ncbi:S9 family peptidase [Homoserinimonas sp. OAct 916]|uniref:S9 family peptidase n=1 Tax=Homoserinimonas sp. OAct 916 TaxID=2211450 RepID=UPI000DBE6820|nr:S9 family peptidase [Homoserinimonas sp. OAct 916]